MQLQQYDNITIDDPDAPRARKALVPNIKKAIKRAKNFLYRAKIDNFRII